MDEKIVKFDDNENETYKSQQYKRPISINNIDVKKIVVSNKISLGKNHFKYYISYKDVTKNIPLCIILPKISAYRRDTDKTKCISFLMKDEKILKRYKDVQKKCQ